MKLALFDFDGTITFRDTFLDFIRFAVDLKTFVLGLIQLSPRTAAFSLGVLSSTEIKETVLGFFFKGWPEQRFKQQGEEYALRVLPTIVKPNALARIKWHQEEGDRVIVVSASISNWISGWCRDHNLELISSEMEFLNGQVTGRLASPNCSGKEKVRRIREQVNLDNYETIYAYGDTKGDKEMLSIADKRYYRYFKR